MEHLRQLSAGSQLILRTLVLIALASTGCVSLNGSFLMPGGPLPTETPCQVVAWWNHEVVTADDPLHNGRPTPGIAGRLYLFGPDVKFPVVGDGLVVVDLYDLSSKEKGAEPVLREEWRIDKDSLKLLLRRDTIGWGYTLFLPWPAYKPEVTRVQIKLQYVPQKGLPLFAPSEPTTITAAANGSRVSR